MNAPVKIIAKNKKEKEIVSMFDEIIDEMKKINLREKAEFLESRVSSNLDEELYSELLSVRNQLKRG
jgi:phosphomevalonate kinase